MKLIFILPCNINIYLFKTLKRQKYKVLERKQVVKCVLEGGVMVGQSFLVRQGYLKNLP